MNLDVKGVALKILKYLSRKSKAIHRNDIIGKFLGYDTKPAVQFLLDNEYLQIKDDYVSIDTKGKEYILNYDEFGLSEMANDKYDDALLKFLSLVGEPVSAGDFPLSFLNNIPIITSKGMNNEFHFRSYVQFDSPYRNFFEVKNDTVTISRLGIERIKILKTTAETQAKEPTTAKGEQENKKSKGSNSLDGIYGLNIQE